MGPKLGESKGWLLNEDCDNVNLPFDDGCDGGWMYLDRYGKWRSDPTIRLDCNGTIRFLQ